jgi:hypothetical protein
VPISIKEKMHWPHRENLQKMKPINDKKKGLYSLSAGNRYGELWYFIGGGSILKGTALK